MRSAVERQFEIIGEALGKANILEPQAVENMAELPRIVGLRNRLIHGYDSVTMKSSGTSSSPGFTF